MLESINYSLIESNQLLTFAGKIAGFFGNFDAKSDKYVLASFISRLNLSLEEYSKAYERESKNPYTLKIDAADRKRDSSFLAFRNYVVACSHRTDEGWGDASSHLLGVITKHGWRANYFGYKAETAALNKVVNEINDLYASDINLLGATLWFNQLASDEQAFEQIQKESDTREPSNLPILTEKRPALVKAIRNLFSVIDSHYSENTTDSVLVNYVNALNEIIISTMSLARANQTRVENQKKATPVAVPGDTTVVQ
jgi:hypothetical protein